MRRVEIQHKICGDLSFRHFSSYCGEISSKSKSVDEHFHCLISFPHRQDHVIDVIVAHWLKGHVYYISLNNLKCESPGCSCCLDIILIFTCEFKYLSLYSIPIGSLHGAFVCNIKTIRVCVKLPSREET